MASVECRIGVLKMSPADKERLVEACKAVPASKSFGEWESVEALYKMEKLFTNPVTLQQPNTLFFTNGAKNFADVSAHLMESNKPHYADKFHPWQIRGPVLKALIAYRAPRVAKAANKANLKASTVLRSIAGTKAKQSLEMTVSGKLVATRNSQGIIVDLCIQVGDPDNFHIDFTLDAGYGGFNAEDFYKRNKLSHVESSRHQKASLFRIRYVPRMEEFSILNFGRPDEFTIEPGLSEEIKKSEINRQKRNKYKYSILHNHSLPLETPVVSREKLIYIRNIFTSASSCKAHALQEQSGYAPALLLSSKVADIGVSTINEKGSLLKIGE